MLNTCFKIHILNQFDRFSAPGYSTIIVQCTTLDPPPMISLHKYSSTSDLENMWLNQRTNVVESEDIILCG